MVSRKKKNYGKSNDKLGTHDFSLAIRLPATESISSYIIHWISNVKKGVHSSPDAFGKVVLDFLID